LCPAGPQGPAGTPSAFTRGGYVWANNATSASYSPSAGYSYNSTGGANTITRSGVGVYAVTFAGLVPPAAPFGNVQVTAYGGGAGYCKVASWVGTPDLTVSVRCFDGAGASIDSLYSVLVMY